MEGGCIRAPPITVRWWPSGRLRPLFFYVKGEHIGTVPGIAEYVEFFLSDQMAGLGGTLETAGLIPAPAEETAEVLAAFQDGKALTAADLK